ncbi:MAG: enoyl-CoA hydratase-related protein, partial [Rhodomicrobium sp.]
AALDARVTDLAMQIASLAPLTLRSTKEAFRRMQARSSQEQEQDYDLILMCYMSDDFREGMAAFLEKRAPQWKGR